MTTPTKGTKLSTVTPEFVALLRKFADFIEEEAGLPPFPVDEDATKPKKGKSKKAKAEKSEPEPEEDEDVEEDTQTREEYRASFNGKRLTTLQKVAAEAKIKKPSADRATLLDQLVIAKFGEEETEPEEVEEDEPKSKKGKKDKGKKSKKDDEPEFKNAKAYEAHLSTLDKEELQKLAIKAGFDKDAVADAKKKFLIENLVDDKFEDAEEDESGEDELTREELAKMKLPELKRIAKEKRDQTTDSLRGKDSDSVIDIILGVETPDAEDEEEEDEAEDGEDFYSRKELQAMSLKELRVLCDEYEIEYDTNVKKAELIDLLLEDEDED